MSDDGETADEVKLPDDGKTAIERLMEHEVKRAHRSRAAILEENIEKSRTGKTRRGHPRKGVRKHGEEYPLETKVQAVATYLLLGNNWKTEDVMGLPRNTLSAWKRKDWWPELIAVAQKDHSDEIGAKFNYVMGKALDVISERLESGDHIYDSKNQEVVRVPVKAKDAAVIAAISYDKRALIRGEPTSRTETSPSARLERLAEQFERLNNEKTIDGEAHIVPD